MLSYYAELFARALYAIPSLLGSNVLGLIWPVIVVFCGEIIAGFSYGWRVMISNKWKQASIIGFAALGICYTLLFAWCALTTNYSDHATLASKVSVLQAAYNSNTADKNYAVLEAQSGCAETIGENKTLGKQNRDQQNTINNCQTQALKLLVPEPFKIVPLLLEPASGCIEMQHIKWLLLTNKTVTPVNLVVACQKRFVSASASIVGSEILGGGASKVTDTEYQVNISTPAWSPESPMLFDMSFIGDQNNSCRFYER